MLLTLYDPSHTQVIRLQTFARRWLAQQAVDRLRKERARRLAWLEMQERRRNEEKEEQLRDRRNRWLNPKRQEDFNLLYQALESRLQGREEFPASCLWMQQSSYVFYLCVSQSGGARRSRGSARPCEELRGKQLSARCWTRRWISSLLSDAITSPFTATTTTKLSGTSWTRSEVAPPPLLQLSTQFHNLSFICK